MRTERRTDITKLTVTLRNFAKALKKLNTEISWTVRHITDCNYSPILPDFKFDVFVTTAPIRHNETHN